MKVEQGTRELLIGSAKKEFSEKGYMKASLRKICSEAGVTTGSLYFFFNDKEELFGALVDEPINGLFGLLYRHFNEEDEILAQAAAYAYTDGEHGGFPEELIRHLYDHYDAFILLIKKSQGSRYGDFLDDVTMFLEKRYFTFMSDYAKEQHMPAPNAFFVHFIIHIAVDSLVQLLLHEKDVEKAVGTQKKLMDFIVNGSVRLMFST
ncbi:MAG: TetR/AcrR family transcriptional regulator [Lachnospiraceae bacterium]|nr:TetR/AcrR family transcriptional regulator [Lachnospiraceae bacterium]